jgi:transposase
LASWYKRLEVGCFQLPDAGDRDGIELDPAQLAMILSGIDLRAARRRQRFRPAGRIPPKYEENSSERDLHNSDILV